MNAPPFNNHVTESKGRVDSDKTVPLKAFASLVENAKKHLRYDETYAWDANIDGIIVRLITNSQHQMDFWMANWWPAPNNSTVAPHAMIHSVKGVPGEKPFAYYCPETNSALFVNTEYYGQCKSWALGLAAVALERNFNTHSIHGACAEVDGRGVVIIAPTGTGKTTQVNRLLQHAKGRVVGDDWIYIRHPEDIDTIADPVLTVHQPERSLYVRTENALKEPWLVPIFDRCKLENVVTDRKDCHHEPGEPCAFDQGATKCYWGFANSRAILPREWMKGPHKVADTAPVHLVVLLRRDKESPACVELDADDAIRILREGRTLIRPGAGPKEKWGTYGSEPWYNPYLLAPDHARQERFFRDLLRAANCVIINTGAPGESVERTYSRILEHLDVT